MSIVLQSSGGGQITIQEPATASNFTQTLPAATGTVMVSGNMPAFSAYASAIQSISTATNTKITFDTEEFDTNNNFASSTFTPTVAGYYQINASVSCSVTSGGPFVMIYKNGSAYKRGNQATTSAPGLLVNSIVYLNGSTDYVEIYYYQSSGASANTNAGSQLMWFNGAMIRAA